MFNLNPYRLFTVKEAYEFLHTLPKTFEFWDDTSPELREAYKTFCCTVRKEVRQLIKHVLAYDLDQVFEGETVPKNLFKVIRYHANAETPYFVWKQAGNLYFDSRRPTVFETLWIIQRAPDQCTKIENDLHTQYRLANARFPTISALNS